MWSCGPHVFQFCLKLNLLFCLCFLLSGLTSAKFASTPMANPDHHVPKGFHKNAGRRKWPPQLSEDHHTLARHLWQVMFNWGILGRVCKNPKTDKPYVVVDSIDRFTRNYGQKLGHLFASSHAHIIDAHGEKRVDNRMVDYLLTIWLMDHAWSSEHGFRWPGFWMTYEEIHAVVMETYRNWWQYRMHEEKRRMLQ